VFVPPRLYAVVDSAAARERGWRLPDLADALLAGGVRFIQLRVKAEPSAAFLEWADALVARGQRYGAVVIVNDRADIARAADAAGVHVGQGDLPPRAVRGVAGPGAIVGLSTHSREQVDAAAGEPIDYVAVGPIFDTTSKHAADPAVGLELVRYAAARAAGRPVVAIGGITIASAPAIIAAGASAVAVISDLLVTRDPERRAREYLDALA
jgi:thiamine-phosphate pyrophosphorylase